MVGFLGVYGHVVLDEIITVPQLPKANTSIGILERRWRFGGTGGNLARWAGSLGVDTSLAAFVGEDFPAKYREALEKSSVDLTDLRSLRGQKTPLAWIFGDPRGNQMAVFDQGAMGLADRRALAKHTVRNSRVVHLMTGHPAYHRRVAALAKRLQREIALDPSQEIHYRYGPGDLKALVRGARYFFGNESEIARAVKLLRLQSVRDLASRVPVVVRTLGTRGSVIYQEGERIPIPRVRGRRTVDASGAGDAYRAGFYAGLSRQFTVEQCGVLGATAASFAVEHMGTQESIPTWRQLVSRAAPHLDSIGASKLYTPGEGSGRR